jgi:phage shock protein C
MKKLYRMPSKGQLSGVCAGLSEYLNVDVTIVRIAFVLGIVIGGSALLAYLLLWIILPVAPRIEIRQEEPVYTDSFQASSSESDNYRNFSPPSGSFTMDNSSDNPNPQPQERWSATGSTTSSTPEKPKDKDGRTVGFILVAIGVVFLANELIPEFNWNYVWPSMLIAIGGFFLFRR